MPRKATKDLTDKIEAIAKKKRSTVADAQPVEILPPATPGNADLFPELAAVHAADRRAQGLAPARYMQRDFFIADFVGVSLKDDVATMDSPMFTLAKNKDLSEWHWSNQDGSRWIHVVPSVRGRATIFDKDVLIYLATQLTHGFNEDRPDVGNRWVRFTVHDYLVATNKSTGGRDYERLDAAIDRLKGTMIKTNIQTGGTVTKDWFSIIERVRIIEKSPDDERMIAVEVLLSEWFYEAIKAREVLTLHPNYFRLTRALERRFYEIARKFCGKKPSFLISEDLLYQYSGSKASIRSFRQDAQEVADADNLPDYRFAYNAEKRQWTIYTKDQKKLTAGIAKKLKKGLN